MRSPFILAAFLLTAAAQAQVTTVAVKSAPAGSFGSTYWGDSERGWHWYEDPPAEAKPRPLPTPKPQAPAPPAAAPKPPELAAFEALTQQLEERLKTAFINPTEANVRAYLDLQAVVVEKSSYFADVWQRVVWATPELDPTVTGRPVNAKALETFQQELERQRGANIAALAKTHALFFFFRGECPYCHQFAPYLRAFETKFGLQVVPVSLDGGVLPAFPHARADNGIARTLDIKTVPALYLAEPATGKIVPVGFGVLSEGELMERIYAVSRPEAEKMAPSLAKRLGGLP